MKDGRWDIAKEEVGELKDIGMKVNNETKKKELQARNGGLINPHPQNQSLNKDCKTFNPDRA